MMHEILSSDNTHEQTLSKLKELAAALPKINEVDVDQSQTHSQHRGNFFKRFGEIKAVREERAADDQVFYVRMVKERFGLDLLSFYDEHLETCEAICTAVDAKEPYDRLVAGCEEMLLLEQSGVVAIGSAAEISEATGHPLGVEAVGMYYWDRINPLLEHAYEFLDERTLNAPFLTY